MKRDILVKTKQLGRNINLLYVEDEESTRSVMEPIFKQFFENVYVAKNGEEGLKIFNAQSIDMVFTDIEMPVMNGLDMIQKIREVSCDVPVGVISAFNDTDKFTRAIRHGVNRYLIKPVEEENMLNTIHGMLLELNNKIDAKRYHQELQKKEMSLAVTKTAQYFLQSIPSPVFVLDKDQNILYLNDLLINMLESKGIQVKIGDSVTKIESIFTFKNGSNISFLEIEPHRLDNPKIIFEEKKNKLFFIPRKQDIEIPSLEGVSSIFILNDITLQIKQIHIIEYQKEKLKLNKEILEDFLHKNIFKKPDKEEQKPKEVPIKSDFNENSDLLRRSHMYKISAQDYMTTLNETVQDDLDELNELELDLQSELYELEYSKKIETLQNIVTLFREYTKPLIRLIEFSDLAEAVEEVADYMDTLTQEQIDTQLYMIKITIQSVLDDLVNWKETVFITQTTDDIHYLDSSLYNTIIELKNSFEEKDEEDDDELEFF